MRRRTARVLPALLLFSCVPSEDQLSPDECVPAPEVDPVRVFSGRRALLHAIARGDTLSQLAERFRVPVSVLVEWNQLHSPDLIVAGHGLLVPENTPWTDGLPHYQPIPAHLAGDPLACEAAAWKPPVARISGACEGEHACAEGPGRLSVCACASSEDAPAHFTLRRGAKRLAEWNAQIPFDPTNFSVQQADLDGDGAPEIVTSSLQSVSNGLAIDTYDHTIFRADTSSLLRFDSVGTLDLAQSETGCDVLVDEFGSAYDPRRGEGSYFFTRRFVYQGQALWPLPGPLPAARVGYEGRQAWPHDLALDGGAPTEEARGTITRAEVLAGHTWGQGDILQLQLRAPDGSEVTWTEGFRLPQETGGSAAPLFERLGERELERLYPEGYAPAPASLLGRQAVMTRYQQGQTARWVVWLE